MIDERERAVLATAVVTAMKAIEPKSLDPWIAQLQATPWEQALVQVLKAVRTELDRQRHATRSRR